MLTFTNELGYLFTELVRFSVAHFDSYGGLAFKPRRGAT